LHFGAAKFFLINNLSDCSFDQRGTCEIQAAAFRHQNFVTEHRQIGATCHAVPHDRRKLRNSSRGNHRVVPKYPPEIIFIRKNFILHRQKDARGIDEIDDRKGALKGNPLSAQKLLARRWKERTRFHGRIIRNDHAWNATNVSDPCDHSRSDNVPPLLVHFVSCPEADLEELRVFIQELGDPLPRRQTAKLALAFQSSLSSALPEERLLF